MRHFQSQGAVICWALPRQRRHDDLGARDVVSQPLARQPAGRTAPAGRLERAHHIEWVRCAACRRPNRPPEDGGALRSEHGFSLVEMLIASMLLVVLGGSVLALLVEIEQVAGFQSDQQAALQNTLLGMDLVERLLRQAGNDPRDIGLNALSLAAPNQVRACADLTGASAPGSPDKGDADGDTNDSFEDVVIRRNSSADTLEVVPAGGGVLAVAENITGFSINFFSDQGAPIPAGPSAVRARIALSGRSRTVNPRSRRAFALQLAKDVHLVNIP